MACEPINDLTLDEFSRDQLEDIRHMVRNRSWIQKILAGFGAFSVTTSSKGLEAAYNADSIAWEDVGNGIRDLKHITKEEIRRRAEMNMFSYLGKSDQQSRKHLRFWQGIATQCDPFTGPKSGQTYF